MCFSLSSFATETAKTAVLLKTSSDSVVISNHNDEDCYLVTITVAVLQRNVLMSADDPEAYTIEYHVSYEVWCFE